MFLPLGPRQEDITGRQFGELTVLGLIARRNKRAFWLCKCSCGGTKEAITAHLKAGGVKSCGCKTNEWKARNATKHGAYGSGAYKTWIEINRRCRNPKFQDWDHYGGRGITICERWREFANFLEDMGERPFPSAEIERIDNSGNYEPGNCRWATRKEQMANTRASRLITAFGRTQILQAWADEYGISATSIHGRLRKGMTPEQAISLTADNRKQVHALGVDRALGEWAQISGIDASTINRRLKLGWPPDDAVSRPVTRGKKYTP